MGLSVGLSPRLEARRADAWAPVVTVLAVLVGLALILVATPIVGRGDYGQWLMTSRFYLGEPVPEYRTITALPPLIPMFLAAVQRFIPDPVGALQASNVLLLAGLGLSLFAVGAALGRSAIAGAFTVAVGLLVTDRFLELFAFGGLLQAGSVMFTSFSVAAFVQAGRGPHLRRRWWIAGSALLALAALSHVGAGTLAVPVGLAAAGIAAFRLRGLGWPVLRHALLPVIIALAGIGVYWLLVLLPAGRDYVTNPASLGYRGPERLFSALFDYWPTGLVIVVGMATVVVGLIGELLRREVDRYAVLAAWVGITWGALLVAVVTGASTDFPRFAPVILAPLVPAAALALHAVARTTGISLHERVPNTRPSTWVAVLAAGTMIAAIPFAVARYDRQAATYQPRDAEALTNAVLWTNQALGDPSLAVLTAVRDGKWLEGLTGREALFSLPVRYAFRSTEWQRSVDADAVLRSSAALTNEFFFLKYTDTAAGPTGPVPSNLIIAVNHGGEFLEVLRLAPSDTRLTSVDGTTTVGTMAATGASAEWTDTSAAIRTDWAGRAGSVDVTVARNVEMWRDGATLHLVDIAAGATLDSVFLPPSGMAFTSVDIVGPEAEVCFTQVGATAPCLRLWVSQDDAILEATPPGGLRVRTTQSTRLDIHITALTAAGPSVGLGILDPNTLVSEHAIGAAILVATEPAFAFRRERLESLGFEMAYRSGPYAVLVRPDARADRSAP